MKYAVFFIALVLSLTAPAQNLTLFDIGLPEDLSVVSYNAITSSETASASIRNGRVTFPVKTLATTGYSLNFFQDKIYEEDFEYAGDLVFIKPVKTWTVNGVSYSSPAQKLTITKESTGRWIYKLTTYSETYRVSVNGRIRTVPVTEIALTAGISVDQVHDLLSQKFYAFPTTAISSVFIIVDQQNGGYIAKAYENLRPAANTYSVNWIFYNGCTGNLGECNRYIGSVPPGGSSPQTYIFDLSADYAVVECAISGKSFTDSGYYTVKGCDIDDPCGKAFRLPRK